MYGVGASAPLGIVPASDAAWRSAPAARVAARPARGSLPVFARLPEDAFFADPANVSVALRSEALIAPTTVPLTESLTASRRTCASNRLPVVFKATVAVER
jgi:hypothetical protein